MRSKSLFFLTNKENCTPNLLIKLELDISSKFKWISPQLNYLTCSQSKKLHIQLLALKAFFQPIIVGKIGKPPKFEVIIEYDGF